MNRTNSILAPLFAALLLPGTVPAETTPEFELTIPVGDLAARNGVASVDGAFQQVALWNTWADGQLNLETGWSVRGGMTGNATFGLAVYDIRAAPDANVEDVPPTASLLAQTVHSESVQTNDVSGSLVVSVPLESGQELLAVLNVEACDSGCTDASWVTVITPGAGLLEGLATLTVIGEGDFCTNLNPSLSAAPYTMAVNTDSSIIVQQAGWDLCGLDVPNDVGNELDGTPAPVRGHSCKYLLPTTVPLACAFVSAHVTAARQGACGTVDPGETCLHFYSSISGWAHLSPLMAMSGQDTHFSLSCSNTGTASWAGYCLDSNEFDMAHEVDAVCHWVAVTDYFDWSFVPPEKPRAEVPAGCTPA